jgi:hypothetical protein
MAAVSESTSARAGVAAPTAVNTMDIASSNLIKGGLQSMGFVEVL